LLNSLGNSNKFQKQLLLLHKKVQIHRILVFSKHYERKNILHIQTVTFELVKIGKMHVLRL
jgi:hypothetical protein